MNKEQKRKLRNISLLALAGLIGGTFAFTAFNQQAINDRLRDNEVEVGGRVHDYYNRDTENKDVFVENYGQTPIMARIRLSEFMEIQGRGQDNFTPVVEGTSRENTQSWSTYIPSAGAIGTRTGAGAAFNHNDEDLRTAAAGDARDYLEEGATHPGDGTDAYWSEGESHDNSTGTWPGSQVTRETAQNLPQDQAPITLQEWAALEEEEKSGNFWVMDQNTGWAYWANLLNVGQTTSYLLDAAEMTPDADAINGTYYYGIHVDSQLISPDREFEDESEASGDLSDLLESIRTDADGNPFPDTDAPVSAFNFSRMESGRIFTMAGEQYRYLDDMGEGNHMIIRNGGISTSSFNTVDSELDTWYSQLKTEVQDIVQPVANPFPWTSATNILFDGPEERWLPNNLSGVVAEDLTVVVPEGSKRAFSLSLADVTRLSREGSFVNNADRVSVDSLIFWWLRTRELQTMPGFMWMINNINGGTLERVANPSHTGGIRPALLIEQLEN